ncbi:hypothetical protein H7J07_04790 [Mycobacterium koreense]|uniref:Uncharacterized protein n=1 Tax=Mycolicibacillus koreensis TaxID=1069220 RepID=A0A7I7SB56_9MYCO|nr:hypothetical protein [Mycolicibacillus koreensis]MCV7247574.1 hypothetical protein [Mycolicibacillus koreensis]OSC32845.1 hypothetical protein B8W67_14095 [Mycolicibacillus koreensis]BBY53953.1 hypothetical protein MKOR_12040 [Mycolicibacillus koreensis]
MRTVQTKPLELQEGDAIDLLALMDAAETAFDYGSRAAAEERYAIVESVEAVEPWATDPSQRLVLIGTDICDIAVPENHPVTVAAV